MRSVALLFTLFFSAAGPIAGPACAVESKILDTFKSWLSDEPDGVEGLPADRCDSPEARDALLKFALAAGPSGVETEERTAAVAEIYKIAGAPVPQ